jgi:hypothetical protein
MNENLFTPENIKLVPTDKLKVMVYDMSSDISELKRRIDLCNNEIQKRFLEEEKLSMVQQKEGS